MTRNKDEKTFSGQVCGCKIKNITENECFNFISKRILLLLRCMTKPVVMINNVLEAQSSCVRVLCELNAGSNEYNALLYIPSVIQLFCMVFFVARHIYNLNNVYVCVPMFLPKSRFLQQNRNLTYSYIGQIFANCLELK